jgi:hypothetical protein
MSAHGGTAAEVETARLALVEPETTFRCGATDSRLYGCKFMAVTNYSRRAFGPD